MENQRSFQHYIVNRTLCQKPLKINIFQIWHIAWVEKGVLNAKQEKISSEKKNLIFLDWTNQEQKCLLFSQDYYQQLICSNRTWEFQNIILKTKVNKLFK